MMYADIHPLVLPIAFGAAIATAAVAVWAVRRGRARPALVVGLLATASAVGLWTSPLATVSFGWWSTAPLTDTVAAPPQPTPAWTSFALLGAAGLFAVGCAVGLRNRSEAGASASSTD